MDAKSSQYLADRIAAGKPPEPPRAPRPPKPARVIEIPYARAEPDDRPWPWAVALAEAVRG